MRSPIGAPLCFPLAHRWPLPDLHQKTGAVRRGCSGSQEPHESEAAAARQARDRLAPVLASARIRHRTRTALVQEDSIEEAPAPYRGAACRAIPFVPALLRA